MHYLSRGLDWRIQENIARRTAGIRVISYKSFYFYAVRKGLVKPRAKKTLDIFISFYFHANHRYTGGFIGSNIFAKQVMQISAKNYYLWNNVEKYLRTYLHNLLRPQPLHCFRFIRATIRCLSPPPPGPSGSSASRKVTKRLIVLPCLVRAAISSKKRTENTGGILNARGIERREAARSAACCDIRCRFISEFPRENSAGTKAPPRPQIYLRNPESSSIDSPAIRADGKSRIIRHCAHGVKTVPGRKRPRLISLSPDRARVDDGGGATTSTCEFRNFTTHYAHATSRLGSPPPRCRELAVSLRSLVYFSEKITGDPHARPARRGEGGDVHAISRFSIDFGARTELLIRSRRSDTRRE